MSGPVIRIFIPLHYPQVVENGSMLKKAVQIIVDEEEGYFIRVLENGSGNIKRPLMKSYVKTLLESGLWLELREP